MTRTLAISASVLLLMSAPWARADDNGAEPPTATAPGIQDSAWYKTSVQVPIPIARPAFIIQRVAVTGGTEAGASRVVAGAQVAQGGSTGTGQGGTGTTVPGATNQDATDQGGTGQMRTGTGTDESTSTTTAAPAQDGTGMKSGSPQALAVQLEGAKVLSTDGDVVGEVEKVVDEPGAGQQAVVTVGGFLGIGQSRVLVPTETMTPSGSGMVRVELTEDQLKSLPAYEEK